MATGSENQGTLDRLVPAQNDMAPGAALPGLTDAVDAEGAARRDAGHGRVTGQDDLCRGRQAEALDRPANDGLRRQVSLGEPVEHHRGHRRPDLCLAEPGFGPQRNPQIASRSPCPEGAEPAGDQPFDASEGLKQEPSRDAIELWGQDREAQDIARSVRMADVGQRHDCQVVPGAVPGEGGGSGGRQPLEDGAANRLGELEPGSDADSRLQAPDPVIEPRPTGRRRSTRLPVRCPGRRAQLRQALVSFFSVAPQLVHRVEALERAGARHPQAMVAAGRRNPGRRRRLGGQGRRDHARGVAEAGDLSQDVVEIGRRLGAAPDIVEGSIRPPAGLVARGLAGHDRAGRECPWLACSLIAQRQIARGHLDGVPLGLGVLLAGYRVVDRHINRARNP